MKLRLFTLTTLAVLGFTACSEKEPDPCAALKPVSADFDFYDGNTKIDTFMLPATVTFKAKDSTAQSYAWSFPNGENTSDKKQFTLTFHNETGHVPVQLILKNKPQTACFPKDDGIDTVQKSIYLLHWMEADRLPYIGTFVGSDDTNPNHKFEIYIKLFNRPEPEPVRSYWAGARIFNLPEGCSIQDTSIFSWSPSIEYSPSKSKYKTFRINAGNSIHNNCMAVFGDGVSINNDKIEINYTFLVWNNSKKDWDKVKRKFTGYRKK
jgi:hypothetical protein